MIVAGGVQPNVYPHPNVAGDTWTFPLRPVEGPWANLPATGGAMIEANFAGYDPDGHRFAAMVSGAPAFLSMDDSSWTVAGPALRPLPQTLARFYDAGANLFVTADADSMFTIHPGTDAAWTRTGLGGSKPLFDYSGTMFLDAPRHRYLLFGGMVFGVFGSGSTSTAIHSLDYVNGNWSTLQASTPLGIRTTAPMHDTRRNRLVFFGGGHLFRSSPPEAAGDLWSFDLETLDWTALAAGGMTPTPRYYFPAAYDSARDRGIVFGGGQFGNPQRGVHYLQFGPAEVNGTWSRNDPLGESVPDFPGLDGSLDPGLDRFFVPLPGVNTYLGLEWDAGPERLVVDCPPPTAWTPGSILPLSFSVAQGVTATTTYVWKITSERNWPGFPLQGFQDLTGSDPVLVGVGIPVPDTAAAGVHTLEFTFTEYPNSSAADTCRFRIGDPVSPAPWALFEVRAEVDRVRLAWWTSDRAHAIAHVERRTEHGSWQRVGEPAIGGDGLVRFEDAAVEPGGRYAYRAGIPGGAWSGDVEVEVPGAALTFAHRGILVVRRALAATFTLPSAGAVRLEAFDLAGRRVASRSKEDLGAGVHSVTLADASDLGVGVYFLRLTQNGARVTARALVLPSP